MHVTHINLYTIYTYLCRYLQMCLRGLFSAYAVPPFPFLSDYILTRIISELIETRLSERGLRFVCIIYAPLEHTVLQRVYLYHIHVTLWEHLGSFPQENSSAIWPFHWLYYTDRIKTNMDKNWGINHGGKRGWGRIRVTVGWIYVQVWVYVTRICILGVCCIRR